MLVYHGTTRDRLSSILRNGLRRDAPPQQGTPDAGLGGIYVVTRRKEARRFGDREVTLTLSVPSTWLQPDVNAGEIDAFVLRVKRVPPGRIVAVTRHRPVQVPRVSGLVVSLDASPPPWW